MGPFKTKTPLELDIFGTEGAAYMSLTPNFFFRLAVWCVPEKTHPADGGD